MNKEDIFKQAGDRESDLRRLDELVKKHAPALKPVTMSGMYGDTLAYGMVPYKTKSMKVASEWPILSIKAQKNHISIYACAVIDGRYIAEIYENKLGKVDCGKSCIRFKATDDLDEPGFIGMLEDINSRFDSGEKLFGM